MVKRFLETLFEKASTIELDKLTKYKYKEDDSKAEKGEILQMTISQEICQGRKDYSCSF